VPKGSSITSLVPSPDGRFIAVSATSSLLIGSTPDAVFVLRAADGSEALRRYFPKFTRGSVAFADAGHFVYTDLTGVNVLRVALHGPPSGPPRQDPRNAHLRRSV
jgi:hypothetical protein